MEIDRNDCITPGCEEIAAPGRPRCWKCYKRLERGTPLDAPKRESLPPRERLIVAAIELADADSEDDAVYAAAEAKLLNAARALGRKDDVTAMLAVWQASVEQRQQLLRSIANSGGQQRAASLSKRERRRIARKAAMQRWHRK